MPMRGELTIPAGRVGSATGAHVGRKAADTIATPEFLKVAGICFLGLAITLLLIYVSPSPGGMTEAITLYP
jgi:hypothetical protein